MMQTKGERVMKTLLPLFVAGIVVLASGCASAPLTKADIDGRVVCNVDRMDQVERAARRTFAEIHWVNCPRATLRVVS
jgi:hypothetical protein